MRSLCNDDNYTHTCIHTSMSRFHPRYFCSGGERIDHPKHIAHGGGGGGGVSGSTSGWEIRVGVMASIVEILI